MQLSDILEEHSLKNMSKKTNISEENIENILKKKFENIERVKAMGFISIIEREFNANLSALRGEAQAYYDEFGNAEKGIVVGVPFTVHKKGKSKFFLVVVFVLLAIASWYFLTQYDKTHFNTLEPLDEASIVETVETEGTSEEGSDIMQTIKEKWQSIVNGDEEAVEIQNAVEVDETPAMETAVEIVEPEQTVVQEPEESNATQVDAGDLNETV